MALIQPAFEKLLSLLHHIDGDYSDPATFARLRTELGNAERPLHYLAIPPSLFELVAEGLAASGCAKNARVVVEKPFGRDLASAQELGQTLHKFFAEENIFRIDHYLGKEPVQNILYTRFANPIFEPIWNRDHIRSIQITMAEDFGVEDRGKFYDEVGALLDVVQNHMMQVVANLTMDPPTGEDHDAVRDRKAELMRAIRPLGPNDVVRGQYKGYRSVPGVAPGSLVETFVAIKVQIESWRWAGVPIYVRAGKMLPVTATEALIEFKRPPRETFGEIVPTSSAHMRIRMSPDMTIGLGVRVKTPGERMVGRDVELEMHRRGPPTICRRTSDCWEMRAKETVNSSRGRTWWNRNGELSIQSWATSRRSIHTTRDVGAGGGQSADCERRAMGGSENLEDDPCLKA